MRKLKTVTRKVEVECCDWCGDEIALHSDRHCFVCNGQGCYRHVRGTAVYGDGDDRAFMDLFVPLCDGCAALADDAGAFLARARAAVDRCDEELRAVMRGWRERAQEDSLAAGGAR